MTGQLNIFCKYWISWCNIPPQIQRKYFSKIWTLGWGRWIYLKYLKYIWQHISKQKAVLPSGSAYEGGAVQTRDSGVSQVQLCPVPAPARTTNRIFVEATIICKYFNQQRQHHLWELVFSPWHSAMSCNIHIVWQPDFLYSQGAWLLSEQCSHTLSDLLATLSALFLDTKVSLGQAPIGRPTPVHPSVGWSNFQIYILPVSLRPHKASIRHYGGRHGCWHGSIDSTILCFSVFWIGKYMIKTEIQI